MRRGIPKVRTWRIAVDYGLAGTIRYRVLAPTRRLAVMNLRGFGEYKPILTVGLLRNPPEQHPAVVRDDG